MCDTLIFKNQDYTLLAKNSDREPNEAQAILHMPRQGNLGKNVKCTYIEIPQVEETFEVILSKPFQMWGAEMGVNEYGVTIGNEAVFTKIREDRRNVGLTGMDLIRLALERSSNSKEALDTICGLIENYGQDACGGYQNKNFYYHNSFLIADAFQAYKLETAGRQWVYQEIHDYDSISNGLTISDTYDGISDDAISYAKRKRWSAKRKPFSFRDAYSDRLYTTLSHCKTRRAKTYQSMSEKKGLTVQEAISILQSHHVDDQFEPAKCNARSICMHPTGILNPSQTNGSMIVKLIKSKAPEIWVTGTSMPCLSIYKPLELGIVTCLGDYPTEKLDKSLWWQAERAHRIICKNYKVGRLIHHEVFREFQRDVFNSKYNTQEAWNKYSELIALLNQRLDSAELTQKSSNFMYRKYLRKVNKTLKV